jgi:hypothetical protein
MCGRPILEFYPTSNVSALGIPSSQLSHANSMTFFRLLTCGGGSRGMAFPGAGTVPGQWSGASVRKPCSLTRSRKVSLRDFSEVQGEKRRSHHAQACHKFHTAHHRQQPQALRLAPQSTARSRQGITWIKFEVQKGAPSEDIRRHRNLRKNWRMSPTRRSGASWAAQWLPRSNSLQETILAWSRSANLRMGRKS